MLEAVIKENPE